MSKLALHINNQLNEIATECFNLFVETGHYQEQDFELLYEMICRNHMFLSEHARWSTDPQWFERYKAASQLLADKLNRINPKPLAGDCVFIGCENGNEYPDALIAYGEDNSGNPGRVSICVRGGGHLVDIHQSVEDSLIMAISGGYFQSVHADEFTEKFDVVDKTFWFWADKPKGNGGIYITRPVRRWGLKNINPDFY